jgi:hypothetical protein
MHIASVFVYCQFLQRLVGPTQTTGSRFSGSMVALSSRYGIIPWIVGKLIT